MVVVVAVIAVAIVAFVDVVVVVVVGFEAVELLVEGATDVDDEVEGTFFRDDLE